MTAPVVLKLGGSLLTIPDLMPRLDSVVRNLRPASVLIVPGGGFAADIVRDLDQRFHLPPEKSHRDAIAAMSLNAALLCRLNRALRLVRSNAEALRVWSEGHPAVLDADSFLFGQPVNDTLDSLPATWDITSDSIAAWTARNWHAERLVLLKSCDPAETNVTALSHLGMVDRGFETTAENLRLEWLNLRQTATVFQQISN